jgi:zinc transport system substrate-binding protein
MRLSVLLLTAILAFACAAPQGQAGGEDAEGLREGHPKVVASIYPLTMLVNAIAGDSASVTTIVPPGADPHNFELTPSSAKAVYEADVVFLIGADFDSWAVGSGDRPAGRNQLRIEFYKSFDDSLIDLGGTFNPHFWLDPLFAKAIGAVIAEALTQIDPGRSSYYGPRAERLASGMDSLNISIKRRLELCGFKRFVSFHPAWTYFARRYNLVEVGVVERFPEQEPSAKWVAELIRNIKELHVQVMIVEETSNPGVVMGIARDTGVKVVVLDPLGSPDIPGRTTYSGLMNYDVSLIERAVQGD